MTLPNCSSGGVRHTDVIPRALAHAPHTIGSGQDGHSHRHLRALPVRLLHLAAQHEVEELVGAAELDVGLQHHRVVRLHQWIQQLEHRNRPIVVNALREVPAAQQLIDSHTRREPEERLEPHRGEPLPISTYLGAVGVEDAKRLLLIGGCVGLDLVRRQHGASAAAPRWIPHSGGPVTDDQYCRMAGVLELTQFPEHDGMPEMDIRRRGVNAQLHPQRRGFRKPLLDLARGLDVNRAGLQVVGAHAVPDNLTTSG